MGENLASFICANFLGTEQGLAKVQALDPARRLGTWLAEPRHAEGLAEHLSSALAYVIGVLDDERVRTFFRSTVVARLEQVDVSLLAGQLLDALTAGQRHQQVLDGILRQLALMLDDESIKAEVPDVVAAAPVAGVRPTGGGWAKPSRPSAGAAALPGRLPICSPPQIRSAAAPPAILQL